VAHKTVSISFRRTVDTREGPEPLGVARLRRELVIARRVLILIHGYNTPQRKARDGYETFVRSMGSAGPSLFWPDLVVYLQWPGDVSISWLPGLVSRSVSEVSFQHKERVADRVGGALCSMLAQVPATVPPRVSVVAHSLGCRLTCRFLHETPSTSSIVVESVVLMAAAVPVADIAMGGRIHGATRNTRALHVMYSRHDSVLRKWFPLGHRASLRELHRAGLSATEAVGLWGRPFTDRAMRFHRATGSIYTHYNTGLEHGEYWSDESNQGLAAKDAARAMGLKTDSYLPIASMPVHRQPQHESCSHQIQIWD